MPRTYRLDRLECPELEQLEPAMRRRIMRQAVRVAALAARQEAPDSGTGHKRKLNKSIRYDVLQAGLTGRVRATAPHAHLVHDGTKPHLIPAPKDPLKRRKMFPLYAGGRPVRHPGARANPFLVRAAEEALPEVLRVMREAAEAAIAEVAG